jgi:uncharacterized lipoprotein YddW (UPF0748 family)
MLVFSRRKLLFPEYIVLALALWLPLTNLANRVMANEILLPAPPREFRAAWLTTVANMDWPSKPGLPVAQQKAELISLLDRAAQLHFNAVFFQVRPVADAFYASPFEPWSGYLTGHQGQAPAPYYDPLAFAIAEAHQRGLQLHAWFNPFRAHMPDVKWPDAPNHITRTHPELVRHYGKQIWLDPGDPKTQAQVLAVMLDVVKRYDVDGVVLDDYFYPYPEENAAGQVLDFPDASTWQRYGIYTRLNRDDWRRENVNHFIQKLSQSVKAAKPWVQFGVSPFGIWRPQNPPSVRGFDSYAKIYADSRKWLANGWVDYLSPQLYWPIAAPQQSFTALFDWWESQNPLRRHVWPCLGDYRVGGKFSIVEIPHQVQIIRQKPDPGAVHFHLRNDLDNPVLAGFIRAQYAQPALVPTSPWIYLPPSAKPKLQVNFVGHSACLLHWDNAGGEPARQWLLQMHIHGAWRTEILLPSQTGFYLNDPQADVITIRAVNRLGNLSEPAVWAPPKPASRPPAPSKRTL